MPNTYTDTPIASHTLAADQPAIEANFLYLANTLGTSLKSGDHQIAVGDLDNASFEGRHLQVCLNNRHGAAPTVAGIGDGTNSMIYSDNGNLFFGSATGAGAFQLTTYNSGGNFGGNPNGWTMLPGGLIMQYGTSAINASGTPTTISFPITFPSAVLSITLGFVSSQGNSPSANSVFIKSGSVATNQFVVTNSSSGGSLGNIYYMAIGK